MMKHGILYSQKDPDTLLIQREYNPSETGILNPKNEIYSWKI